MRPQPINVTIRIKGGVQYYEATPKSPPEVSLNYLEQRLEWVDTRMASIECRNVLTAVMAMPNYLRRGGRGPRRLATPPSPSRQRPRAAVSDTAQRMTPPTTDHSTQLSTALP